MEFLITYGWAFIVILIMVGGLAYFGVLDPAKFLPERCLLSHPFSCSDVVLYQSGPVMKLRNMEEPITITAIRAGKGTLNPCMFPGGTIGLNDGEIRDQGMACFSGPGLLKPGKNRINIEIEYYKNFDGPAWKKTAAGEIISTVEKPSISPCKCDLDFNGGMCNILDYQLFIQDWGRTDCGTPPGTGAAPNDCECDIKTDGKCNILDYQNFIQDWGRTDC